MTLSLLIRGSLAALSFLFYIAIFSSTSNAQQSAQFTYGGTALDKCNDVRVTPDGGWIIAGETESYGTDTRNIYVTKTGPQGNVKWSMIYESATFEMPNSILPSTDGGYLLAGERYPTQGKTELAYLLKINGTGDLQWTKIYDGGGNMAEVIAAQNTSDGGYVITGRMEKTLMASNVFFTMSSEVRYLYLFKTDAEGEIQWSRNYRVEKYGLSKGNAVQQTVDGGYIVVGEIETIIQDESSLDMCLLKVSGQGEVEWIKKYGGDEADAATVVLQTRDGGYLMGGGTRSFGAGQMDICLIKTAADGEVQWAKTIGGIKSDMVNRIVQHSDGSFAIVGTTTSFGAGSGDAYLVKVDEDGNLIWSRTYGGERLDNAASVEILDEGYLLGGNTFSFGEGGMDIYLMKTDAQGDADCNTRQVRMQTADFAPVVVSLNGRVSSELLNESTSASTTNNQRVSALTIEMSKSRLCK